MFRIRSEALVTAVYLTALLTSVPYTSATAQQVAVIPVPDQATPYTFHVTKSEVVIDVIAVDAQNRPVLNLAPADLKLFEADPPRKTAKSIASLRVVDPSSSPSTPSALPQTDFLGLVHGSCMLTYIAHYQLAYDPGPDGSIPGIHTVEIQTKRRGVRLFYRHGYFVSPPIAPEDPGHKPRILATVIATTQTSNQPVTPKFQTDSVAGFSAQRALDYAVNSFGSTVPNAGSLCADVYEIPVETKRLPDFKRLSSIGIIYTDFLAVSRAANVVGIGLPNITTRTEWIGLDYYGRIWITHPGSYEFQMISDDGALLEIDGKPVIDLDGIHAGKMGSGQITLEAGPHTLHIPYFQGPIMAVLTVWVKAPGEPLTIFDTRSFAPQPATTMSGR